MFGENKSKWLASVALGAVVSVLIEHLFHWSYVGGSHFWAWLLQLLTFGSTTVRDAPFASAALNPYPLPSLTTLLVATLATLMAHAFLFGWLSGRLLVWFDTSGERQRHELTKSVRTTLYTVYPGISLLLIIAFTAFALLLVVSFGVENQAVHVRRIYEADRDILSPYLQASEAQHLQAQFSSMNSKADYDRLTSALTGYASKYNVTLRHERF